MVIYRRWEKTCFSSLLFQFGNIFSVTLSKSQQSSCCNCAPIPKMVPHSLNEQKCIGELVRAGCECLRVEVKTSARTRCTHIALSVPSRVTRPCTPFSTKQPILDFHASAPRLIESQDPRPRTKVRLKDLVHVVVMPATLPQTNTTQCPYGRSALANPTRFMWEQKEKTKIETKKKKTAPTDIHVVCKQPKLQYGIERVLSFNSQSLFVRPGLQRQCVQLYPSRVFFSSPPCKKKKKNKKEKKSSLNSLKLFCILFPFLKSSEEKKYYLVSARVSCHFFGIHSIFS